MQTRIHSVVIDCRDTRALGRFWCDVLGYEITVDQPNDWMILRDPDGAGIQIGLQQVPESKIIKNRIHLDLELDSNEFEGEYERLRGLGAVSVRYVENDDGEKHWVMADPEGNEFCLLRPE